MATAIDISGARYLPGYLDGNRQRAVLSEARAIAAAAPMFHPVTRGGKAMSVRMTSAGTQGWFSDRSGYRYTARHPSGSPWPAIPAGIRQVWSECVGTGQPDCCLVNYYGAGARMGLHQDRDERDQDWPVLSISLGDDALFRIGGPRRGGPTRSQWLSSGDVLVLEGASRLAFHGIDRIRAGSSSLLNEGGRINITLRVAG